MKLNKLVFAGLLFLFALPSLAQQSWNLRTVVEHAMANNINVKLADVQARIAAINYKQSRLSVFPNLSLASNLALNAGSTQDPVSFSRVSESYYTANFQLQSSADIFNFFSKQNTIVSNKWSLLAAQANVDKLKNDIALTAANGYLQVLLTKEQLNIAAVQINQTTAQLQNVRKQVDAGVLPPLTASQLEAQLALDSVNFITARGNRDQSILLLKSYMNIDAAVPFEVEAPPVDKIPLETIAELQPEYVYQLAVINMPQQRVNTYQLKAAEKSLAASKGNLLPTLTGFGSLASAYTSREQPVSSVKYFLPIAQTTVGGNNYFVYPLDSLTRYQYGKARFGTQLADYFQQTVGVSLRVPLFNGWNARANLERSRLNIQSVQLQQLQDNQKLKQDIYQAYTAAVIALEKYTASKKNVEVNETAFSYATKRFDVGMLNTFELISTQNNLLRARLEYVLNHFDYVFKMKVLEFYKGQGIKM